MSKKKSKNIDRDALEAAIRKVTGQSITLKQNIPLSDWLLLKTTLHPINNEITLKLTLKFIDKLKDLFPDKIKNKTIEKYRATYKETNVNANGFDFVYKEKGLIIVAEVKANLPYDGNRYGSSQQEGLKKDISGLLNNKSKSQITSEELARAYKFVVQLKYNSGGYNSEVALRSLVKNLTEGTKKKKPGDFENKLEPWKKGTKPSVDKVYAILLPIDETEESNVL